MNNENKTCEAQQCECQEKKCCKISPFFKGVITTVVVAGAAYLGWKKRDAIKSAAKKGWKGTKKMFSKSSNTPEVVEFIAEETTYEPRPRRTNDRGWSSNKNH